MWRRLVCLANVNGAARSSASLYFGLPMFALAIDAMFKLFSPDPEFLATVFQPSKVRMLCSDAKVKVTQQRHRLELSWSFAARVEFPRTNSLLHCSQQMSKRATDHSGDLAWLVMSQPRCLFCGALPKLPLPYPSLTPEASLSLSLREYMKVTSCPQALLEVNQCPPRHATVGAQLSCSRPFLQPMYSCSEELFSRGSYQCYSHLRPLL